MRSVEAAYRVKPASKVPNGHPSRWWLNWAILGTQGYERISHPRRRERKLPANVGNGETASRPPPSTWGEWLGEGAQRGISPPP